MWLRLGRDHLEPTQSLSTLQHTGLPPRLPSDNCLSLRRCWFGCGSAHVSLSVLDCGHPESCLPLNSSLAGSYSATLKVIHENPNSLIQILLLHPFISQPPNFPDIRHDINFVCSSTTIQACAAYPALLRLEPAALFYVQHCTLRRESSRG